MLSYRQLKTVLENLPEGEAPGRPDLDQTVTIKINNEYYSVETIVTDLDEEGIWDNPHLVLIPHY